MKGLPKYKAIYFDAGDTLVYPRSGHWYITPNFFSILDDHSVPLPSEERLESALVSSYPFLDANHSVQTEEEELAQFIEYYRLVFQALDIDHTPGRLLLDIANDMVYNDDKFVFFDDSASCVEELHRSGIRIGILSNTWPSLERVFRNAGLFEYFDAFIVSSRVGCYKPDPRIYREAIRAIGFAAEHLLFVDDSDENLAGGVAAGMLPAKISRYSSCDDGQYPCIENLGIFKDSAG